MVSTKALCSYKKQARMVALRDGGGGTEALGDTHTQQAKRQASKQSDMHRKIGEYLLARERHPMNHPVNHHTDLPRWCRSSCHRGSSGDRGAAGSAQRRRRSAKPLFAGRRHCIAKPGCEIGPLAAPIFALAVCWRIALPTWLWVDAS